MRAAVAAMRIKEMGSFKAAYMFNILQSTLERYIKNVDKFLADIVKPKNSKKPFFHLRWKQTSQMTA
jgi:hypothetical protein